MVRIHQANQIERIFLPFQGSDEVYGNGGHDILHYDTGSWHDGIEVDFAKGTASHVQSFPVLKKCVDRPVMIPLQQKDIVQQ